MTTIIAPMCVYCKHIAAEGLTCAAYPGGIPAAIVESRRDHRQAYRGDGGIRFDPVSEEGAAYAVELFGAREVRSSG